MRLLTLKWALLSFSFFVTATSSNQVLGRFGYPSTWARRYPMVSILRFPQTVPIGHRTYFLLNKPLLAQMVMDLLLCVSFCHSTFPSHIDDRWMGLIGACATMASLEAHDMRLPFSLNGSELDRLWGPPSTIAECGLWCICLFPQSLSLPLGIPKFSVLKLLLLVKYLVG